VSSFSFILLRFHFFFSTLPVSFYSFIYFFSLQVGDWCIEDGGAAVGLKAAAWAAHGGGGVSGIAKSSSKVVQRDEARWCKEVARAELL
jgi:hypothetical protein